MPFSACLVCAACASFLNIMINNRGFFGIGVEGISKAMNVGAIMRTAHAFGASFAFTVGAIYTKTDIWKSDTSKSQENIPLYEFDNATSLRLPKNCKLVGVEFIDEADALPSFRHPSQCAYILGPERGSLSDEILSVCDHTVKIPTKFCLNVSVAAAIIMYDRTITLGRHAPRPVRTGGPTEVLPLHEFGDPVIRRKK